jgi:hypothetical protein
MTGRSFDIDMLVTLLRQRLNGSNAAAWLPVDDLVQECLAHLHERGWLQGQYPMHILLYRACRIADEAAYKAKAWHDRHLLFHDIRGFKPGLF